MKIVVERTSGVLKLYDANQLKQNTNYDKSRKVFFPPNIVVVLLFWCWCVVVLANWHMGPIRNFTLDKVCCMSRLYCDTQWYSSITMRLDLLSQRLHRSKRALLFQLLQNHFEKYISLKTLSIWIWDHRGFSQNFNYFETVLS